MVYFLPKTIQSDGDYYDVLINVAKKKNGEFVYDITVRENKKRISPSAAYKNVPTLQGRKSSSNNSIRDSAENINDNQKKFSVRDRMDRELFDRQQEYLGDSEVTDEANRYSTRAEDAMSIRMVLWGCMFHFRCCFASRYKHVDVKARLKLSVLRTFS